MNQTFLRNLWTSPLWINDVYEHKYALELSGVLTFGIELEPLDLVEHIHGLTTVMAYSWKLGLFLASQRHLWIPCWHHPCMLPSPFLSEITCRLFIHSHSRSHYTVPIFMKFLWQLRYKLGIDEKANRVETFWHSNWWTETKHFLEVGRREQDESSSRWKAFLIAWELLKSLSLKSDSLFIENIFKKPSKQKSLHDWCLVK